MNETALEDTSSANGNTPIPERTEPVEIEPGDKTYKGLVVKEFDLEEVTKLALSDPETEKTPESVLKLLIDRAKNGYKTGINENDNYKIGLAFDSGGYAGVVQLAMSKKLDTYFYKTYGVRLPEIVNGVMGNSVGGPIAAYTVTGQQREALQIFIKRMPERFVKHFPFADMSVLEDSMYDEYPLDQERLEQSNTPVIVGATRVNTWRTPIMVKSRGDSSTANIKEVNHQAVSDQSAEPAEIDTVAQPELKPSLSSAAKERSVHRFIEWLTAGSHLLGLANQEAPQDQYGNEYTDASTSWPTPVDLAVQEGYTHVLSFANFLPGETEKKISRKAKAASFLSEMVMNILVTSFVNDKNTFKTDRGPLSKGGYWRSFMKLKKESPLNKHLMFYKGVNVERVFPADIGHKMPDLLEGETRVLLNGIRAGRLAIRHKLEETPGITVVETSEEVPLTSFQ